MDEGIKPVDEEQGIELLKTTIDWTSIKTLDDLDSLDESLLYDESPDEDVNGYELMSGLTAEEIEDAIFWSPYIRGIMLVTGMPGQGKGMFVHMLAYKMRRYFGKIIISDSRPRPLFGRVVPFSQEFLVEQLDRMWEVATGRIKNLDPDNPIQVKPHVTKDGRWISSRGEVFLRKSIMLLDEFGSKYMYRREPHAPIKRTLLKLFTMWRHLQCLIMGIGTERADFDRSCYPKVTCEVRCVRINTPDNPDRLLFGIKIYPLRYIGATGELEMMGQPTLLKLDGDEPRDCLCGKAWKDLYNTQAAVALEPPKSLRSRRQ